MAARSPFGKLIAAMALTASTATLAVPPAPSFPEPARAAADIQAALVRAKASHKRVLLDFGANWCPDCRALDADFQLPANRALLQAHYEVVHINVCRFDCNQALAAHYGVPLNKGIPALAVVDADGKLIYSQRHGEFNSMRSTDPRSLTTFLERWKQ